MSSAKDADRLQDGQNDDGGDDLPTYEYLAERQGPNSRQVQLDARHTPYLTRLDPDSGDGGSG
jgi:hypothetical protein